MSGEQRLWDRLRTSSTRIDFYGTRRRGVVFSVAVSVVAIVSLVAQGLNLGLDFKGGVAWEVPVAAQVDAEAVRQVFEDKGVEASDVRVQTLTSGAGQSRIRAEVPEVAPEIQTELTAELAELAGVSADEVTTEAVSSRWGRSVTDKAVRALVVFLAVVTLFIIWQFQWKMAVAALIAVVHDVLVAAGLYSVLRFEFTPATVVALLTILGYSMYDTIVLFQRIDENEDKYPGTKVAYGDIINISANNVLMRTVNTSVSSLLPVVSLLVVGSTIMGVTALREFALALMIGMIVGFYSSLFVAVPLLVALKEREPRFAALRGRHSPAGQWGHVIDVGSSATGPEPKRNRESAEVPRPAVDGPGAPERVLTHPPRPRKKRRR